MLSAILALGVVLNMLMLENIDMYTFMNIVLNQSESKIRTQCKKI